MYLTKQYDIGLKSLILFGFWILGTRVTVVELKARRSLLVTKKEITVFTTSSSTIGHATWKKWDVKPSRLGAFSPLIENIKRLTSFGITCLISS